MRRALFMVRLWGWLAGMFCRRRDAAERRLIEAAKARWPGGNPRYRCTCDDCWYALAVDIVAGRVK